MMNYMLFLGDQYQFGWESFHSEHHTLSEAILVARHYARHDDSWQIVFRNKMIANRANGFPGTPIHETKENTEAVTKVIASLSFIALLKPARIA